MAASVRRHGECYATFARRRSADLRPRSSRRREDLRLARNADGPYRTGRVCSGRGTANQSEARHQDVIEKCGKRRERRTVRDGESTSPVAGDVTLIRRHDTCWSVRRNFIYLFTCAPRRHEAPAPPADAGPREALLLLLPQAKPPHSLVNSLYLPGRPTLLPGLRRCISKRPGSA